MKKAYIIIGFLVTVMVLSSISVAMAGATLFLGNPPSPSLNGGGTYLFNNEVVPIPNDSLQIMLNGSGNVDSLNVPLWLILAVPNQATLTASINSIKNGSVIGSATGPVYKNNFSSGEIYNYLGWGDGSNDSNSFKNWADAEKAVNGIDVSYFGIFLYDLNIALGGGETLDLTFDGALPGGTFAVAYGEDTGNNDVKSFSTPFTESGMVRVPEPGTLALLGMGLVGIGIFRRRK